MCLCVRSKQLVYVLDFSSMYTLGCRRGKEIWGEGVYIMGMDTGMGVRHLFG